jgi:hypothetical protein
MAIYLLFWIFSLFYAMAFYGPNMKRSLPVSNYSSSLSSPSSAISSSLDSDCSLSSAISSSLDSDSIYSSSSLSDFISTSFITTSGIDYFCSFAYKISSLFLSASSNHCFSNNFGNSPKTGILTSAFFYISKMPYTKCFRSNEIPSGVLP